MNLIDRLTPHAARLLLVALFPFSALDKIIHWNAAMAQATSSFLPGGAVLLVLAIVVESTCPLLIVLRRHDRAAAFVLAGFCLVTAVLYHPFWNFSGLLDPNGGPALPHFWDFLKNLGLAGGLLLLVPGTKPRT